MRVASRMLFLLMPICVLGQQAPQFSQYMMNPYMWNPSIPGMNDQISATFQHRTQWLGYATTNGSDQISPPSTQFFTISSPISKLNSGVGLQIMNDNIGPVRNFNIIGTYSYHVKIGKGRLGAGVGFGLQSMYLNTSQWRPENTNDPVLTNVNSGTLNQLKPNLKFGLSYSNDKIYVGVSINNLYSPIYSFGSSQLKSQLVKHYYVQAAYKIYVNDVMTIQPSFLLQTVPNQSTLQVSNLFLFDKWWSGFGFRSSDAAVLLLGINLLQDKSLKIGYNLDFSLINTSGKSLTSHEIFLSYNIGTFLDNRKPIIRTPRFRF